MSNAKVSERVQESLNLIERRLDADSTLLQQLENCESSYKSLNGRFATIEPTLNTLNTSVNSLTTTESSLLGDLNGFCKQLAEAQVQPPKAGLELELSNKFAENTQLQLRLQKISLEAESLRQGLGERESQTLVLQQSLAEATAECQNLETRNHRIETEKLAMQGEATLVEQRIRHEFTAEKSIATDSIRNEYEQRLEALQKEKNDLESGSEILVQLGGVRDFLVSTTIDWLETSHSDNFQIEAKRIVDDQRRGREALVHDPFGLLSPMLIWLIKSGRGG
jgi:chromosome segregation ATPase